MDQAATKFTVIYPVKARSALKKSHKRSNLHLTGLRDRRCRILRRSFPATVLLPLPGEF
jgi:hypothetical protein